MDIGDRRDLRRAVDRLSATLRVTVPAEVLDAYLRGELAHLPGYEKIVGESRTVPTLVKYLLVAESFLAQPSLDKFFDIFRAARVVPLLRRLDIAVQNLATARVVGHEEKFQRLIDAADFDDFEAVLFEVIVGSRYGEAFGRDGIEFIPERSDAQTPDLLIRSSPEEQFVECKRLDRMTDSTVSLRNEARDACTPIVHALQSQSASAVVEVRFVSSPSAVVRQDLAEAAIASLAQKTTVTIAGADVRARALASRTLETYELFPSPRYFGTRYGYSPGAWHGLLPAMLAKPRGPSFLDKVEWEAAVLWRTEDSDLIWRMKRLAFTTLFKGLEQLQTAGEKTFLHIWFERNLAVGHRRGPLVKLVETLRDKKKDQFAWIVANETVSDVSIGGRFDFQEHPTLIPGVSSGPLRPAVEHVFVGEEDLVGMGDWGVGAVLPSLDDDGS